MQQSPYEPKDPEGVIWDAVIVGSGMGGATLGYALAKAGRRVLFLEKGSFLLNGEDRGNGILNPNDGDSPRDRLSRGWWPNQISGNTTFGEASFFAPIGCGTGGTTGLYAAQLERMSPIDFTPKANFNNIKDSTLPDHWPISYDALAPYYTQAEKLFHVSGTTDPLNRPVGQELLPPPTMSPRDQQVFTSLEELGLNPYRAHVGYDFVDGCRECGATLCPRFCKSDAGKICLLPALQKEGAAILCNCEVKQLSADRHSVKSIRAKRQGRDLTIRAKIFVLAAGTFRSPLLLLSSKSKEWPEGLGNRSGHVGRNLMLHTSDFFAVSAKRKLKAEGPKKTIAFNDYYTFEGLKLGNVQSVGIPLNQGFILHRLKSLTQQDPRLWRKLLSPLNPLAAKAASAYFGDAEMFATIVEDLPYWENRVLPDPASPDGMRFSYNYKPELAMRNRRFRELLAKRLRPKLKCLFVSTANNLNYGHACGTCRFGLDPNESVLNANNRSHDVDNLYVVDASFFPSSGGINPSLTIAANALRVAHEIVDSGQ